VLSSPRPQPATVPLTAVPATTPSSSTTETTPKESAPESRVERTPEKPPVVAELNARKWNAPTYQMVKNGTPMAAYTRGLDGYGVQ